MQNTFFIIKVSGDVPLKGDFDGDGRTDIAVCRVGAWHIQLATERIAQYSSVCRPTNL